MKWMCFVIRCWCTSIIIYFDPVLEYYRMLSHNFGVCLMVVNVIKGKHCSSGINKQWEMTG